MYSFIFWIPLAFVVVSAFISVWAIKKGLNAKKTFLTQVLSVFVVSLICFVCALGASRDKTAAASSSGAKTSVSESESSARAIAYGIGLLAAALSLGIGGIGGGIAVASAAPAAIAALTEDPKTVGRSMVFAIFGEAIAIYGLVISVLILNKLDYLI
ncbi:MAG: ATP synthase subunit C [Oscillospiraceae bacterium]|nr:ATP synthase subunit C [Oscillospiraceae bacterium]